MSTGGEKVVQVRVNHIDEYAKAVPVAQVLWKTDGKREYTGDGKQN